MTGGCGVEAMTVADVGVVKLLKARRVSVALQLPPPPGAGFGQTTAGPRLPFNKPGVLLLRPSFCG